MKGNVLVLGNSGVGKSTLINAVLGSEVAPTSCGIEGTTKHLKIYGEDGVHPFRLIDTVGFEPDTRKARQAIGYVRKWSKKGVEKDSKENKIDLVWFCVDGTAKKLFPKTVEHLTKSISVWKGVPVIVVITKSFSKPERKENVDMVYNAFALQKKFTCNLKAVIPVVATTYTIDETSYAPPEGIAELIDKTLNCLPEGIDRAEEVISKFKLNRKRAMAQSVVSAAVAAAVVVAATPIPFQDSVLLIPIETTGITAINKIFGLKESETAKQLTKTIIECGAVGSAAKVALSALKALPGVNIAASILNAIVAGVIVAIIGEVAILANEQLYRGNRPITDNLDWVVDLVNERFSSNEVVHAVETVVKNIGNSCEKQNITSAIKKLFDSSAK